MFSTTASINSLDSTNRLHILQTFLRFSCLRWCWAPAALDVNTDHKSPHTCTHGTIVNHVHSRPQNSLRPPAEIHSGPTFYRIRLYVEMWLKVTAVNKNEVVIYSYMMYLVCQTFVVSSRKCNKNTQNSWNVRGGPAALSSFMGCIIKVAAFNL